MRLAELANRVLPQFAFNLANLDESIVDESRNIATVSHAAVIALAEAL
jgi:hypothetical protein